MRASNNNRSSTVLDLFLGSTRKWGLPSRVRGDHGVENLGVAAYMDAVRGEGRGSYIWGRQVRVLVVSLSCALTGVDPGNLLFQKRPQCTHRATMGRPHEAAWI
jgi:hypothetical protein